MMYNVIKGEYPFHEVLFSVEAETAEEALRLAIVNRPYGHETWHPVVEPVNGD